MVTEGELSSVPEDSELRYKRAVSMIFSDGSGERPVSEASLPSIIECDVKDSSDDSEEGLKRITEGSEDFRDESSSDARSTAPDSEGAQGAFQPTYGEEISWPSALKLRWQTLRRLTSGCQGDYIATTAESSSLRIPQVLVNETDPVEVLETGLPVMYYNPMSKTFENRVVKIDNQLSFFFVLEERALKEPCAVRLYGIEEVLSSSRAMEVGLEPENVEVFCGSSTDSCMNCAKPLAGHSVSKVANEMSELCKILQMRATFLEAEEGGSLDFDGEGLSAQAWVYTPSPEESDKSGEEMDPCKAFGEDQEDEPKSSEDVQEEEVVKEEGASEEAGSAEETEKPKKKVGLVEACLICASGTR
eukprot:g13603.t2